MKKVVSCQLYLSLIALGVSSSCAAAYANPNFHLTEPHPSDTAWYLSYKIGNTVDDILRLHTQQDASYLFQSDIPYVITEPGVYRLAQSITIGNGAAITIASDHVILDLNQKTIEGIGGQTAHEFAIAADNVHTIVIKNGTIKNCASGIRIAGSSNVLDQVLQNQPDQPVRTNITVDGITVLINKNQLCDLEESVFGIVVVNGQGAHVSNCEVFVDSDNFACDTGPLSNSIDGIVLTGNQLHVEHCTVSGARNNFAFIGSQVVCSDCNSYGNEEFTLTGTITTGFTTFQLDTAEFRNCYSSGMFVNFNFYNTKNFHAQDCTALRGGLGYQANCNGTLVNCVATGQTGTGFEVNASDPQYSAVLIGCQALNNTSNGFRLGGSMILRACTSLHNGMDGIYLDGNDGEIRDCSVAHNAGYGINLNATGLVVCNNIVHHNAAGDLNNVDDSNICQAL